MKSIAIITARGGSKRIPHKNIKLFYGRPIIEYSIEVALDSGLFNEVMVSTDDERIAEIAKNAGASVPFMRSAKNSDDFSTTAEVLGEVLGWYNKARIMYEFACCIYPTAPFITAGKLQQAYNTLITKNADSVLPVTKYPSSIWRSLQMDENNKIAYNWPEYQGRRSQDLPHAFYDCGQFYFFHIQRFLQSGKLIMDNTIGLEVPQSEVQDIDVPEDWDIAELKFNLAKKHDRDN